MILFPREDREDGEFVTIIPRYKGKWLHVKHKAMESYTYPAGRREEGESLMESARRLTSRMTGAKEFALWPVTAYGVVQGEGLSYGKLYFAEVDRLGEVTDPDIDERYLLDRPPEGLTRANNQRLLMDKAERWLQDNQTLLYCVAGAEVDKSTLIRMMRSHYFERVYTCSNREAKGALSALAGDKGAPFETREDLDGLKEAFGRLGAQAFKRILDEDRGRSLVLGLPSDAYEAILEEYRSWVADSDDAAMDKYRIPGELTPRSSRYKKGSEAFCMEFLEDSLIGFWAI